ncbi:LysR family transcriptional regulator [Paludicola sp. MB14-C6]|uniref:LysR family transcriptional regulator n=1 Tax=Paludihabitans sp. MB14-C6 TaxID=3070656 RepID=UPI0027DC8C44|nr:LysR family transcriptional regulator [Paludicola sp. MB14-C6]WMJ22530.1 LysR family transcriptional regulator [Paludicola sp. MB14-C6]
MLDFRISTFLALCKTMSYTKTAILLNLTQPAVTQHIQYLENQYQVKLFQYIGKTLYLTKQGELLQKLATTMQADSYKVIEQLKKCEQEMQKLTIGATLTIGEYALPQVLEQLAMEQPKTQLTMYVENTQELLKRLNDGEIDFAFIEGQFNKEDYSSMCFSKERFIAVCSPSHPFASARVSLEALLNEKLIIREKGSGTRDILETVLQERSLKVTGFQTVTEIGNLNVIKQFVEYELGITFLYYQAAKRELEEETLKQIDVIDFDVTREFHFVFLKNSIFEEKYISFFKYARDIYTKI